MMAQQLFDLGNGFAVCSNPGGRFHGWLFHQHPDGQWVSDRRLEDVAPRAAAITDTLYNQLTRKSGGGS